ncbi:MAG: histidinol-phosphate transaminase [Verrucomicrobiae bacterium]|nr:histidinol-phosphate transaminase [Verrucomicrobiae bacterium]
MARPLDPNRLVRPLVRRLHAYTPGEQPRTGGLVKLNTNENPYPPSPRVLRAIRAATDWRLRLYPSPTAERLREKLARRHGCAVENVIVGNGSDELLALAVRCFVEPADAVASTGAKAAARATVQYFTPSYSLYPVLADAHGAVRREVPLEADFGLPEPAVGRGPARLEAGAALTLVTTPNAPSGRGYATGALDRLCGAMRGVVVLDEAYVDFADEHAMGLALKHPHVLVARTFSKAYSLCFQRVGYFVGHPVLIGALHKIRDSYNVNGLGQVAAEATLEDPEYYRRTQQRVVATRERLARELAGLGFRVAPSQTNFLWMEPPGPPAEQWRDRLRERRMVVRWFSGTGLNRHLRVTVGTDGEADRFLRAVRGILRERRREDGATERKGGK